MSEKRNGSSCLYCGELIKDGPEQAAQMATHIWSCRKHPLERVQMLIDLFCDGAGDYLTPDQALTALKAEVAKVKEAFLKGATEGFIDENEEETE